MLNRVLTNTFHFEGSLLTSAVMKTLQIAKIMYDPVGCASQDPVLFLKKNMEDLKDTCMEE